MSDIVDHCYFQELRDISNQITSVSKMLTNYTGCIPPKPCCWLESHSDNNSTYYTQVSEEHDYDCNSSSRDYTC